MPLHFTERKSHDSFSLTAHQNLMRSNLTFLHNMQCVRCTS